MSIGSWVSCVPSKRFSSRSPCQCTVASHVAVVRDVDENLGALRHPQRRAGDGPVVGEHPHGRGADALDDGRDPQPDAVSVGQLDDGRRGGRGNPDVSRGKSASRADMLGPRCSFVPRRAGRSGTPRRPAVGRDRESRLASARVRRDRACPPTLRASRVATQGHPPDPVERGTGSGHPIGVMSAVAASTSVPARPVGCGASDPAIARRARGALHGRAVQGQDQRRHPRLGAGLVAVRAAEGARGRAERGLRRARRRRLLGDGVLRRADRDAEHRPDRRRRACATRSGTRRRCARRRARAC